MVLSDEFYAHLYRIEHISNKKGDRILFTIDCPDDDEDLIWCQRYLGARQEERLIKQVADLLDRGGVSKLSMARSLGISYGYMRRLMEKGGLLPEYELNRKISRGVVVYDQKGGHKTVYLSPAHVARQFSSNVEKVSDAINKEKLFHNRKVVWLSNWLSVNNSRQFDESKTLFDKERLINEQVIRLA